VLHIDVSSSPATLLEPASTLPATATQASAEQAQAAPAAAKPAAVPSDLQSYLDQQEREILVRALQESGFNRTAAAARLGLSLRQIRYRIARLGIATPGGDDNNGSADD
jgi:two-component system response regulator PilR (NtrC family)